MPNSFLAPGLIGVECPVKGGRGVIAARAVHKGEILVVWGGDVLTRAQLEAGDHSASRLVVQVDDDAYLLTTDEGPADWVNHSCAPNAGLRGQITLVAMRRIKEGEEIAFDYAMSDGSDYDEFDCQCGAPRCRGVVTGSDWRRPDLRRRYAGYFSPYLERRMRAMRRPRRHQSTRQVRWSA